MIRIVLIVLISFFAFMTHAQTDSSATMSGRYFKIHLGIYEGAAPDSILNYWEERVRTKIETYQDGKYVNYVTGTFRMPGEAESYKEELVSKGIKDAFRMVFVDGKPEEEFFFPDEK